jgi:nitroimidazol reductase NimA-like FMN-containing flavoprotein (pyridoxamine 5'-phosphate oxidase superfamily)
LTQQQQNAAQAKAIVDANRYMTLGTADVAGLPWVTPVWYATADYREFLWVSSPAARHSRNIASRRQVAIVIFDSQVPVGGAQAVYISAHADELKDDELERGLRTFSEKSQARGLPAWTGDDVKTPARHRLYRATASELFLLTSGDQRAAVHLDASGSNP